MLSTLVLGAAAFTGVAASPLDSFVPHVIAPYASHPMVARALRADPTVSSFDPDVVAFVGKPDAPFDERLAVLATLAQRPPSAQTAAELERALLGGAFASLKIAATPGEALALAGYVALTGDRDRADRARPYLTAAKRQSPGSFGVAVVAAIIDGHIAAQKGASWCRSWQQLKAPLFDARLSTDLGDGMLLHYSEMALSTRELCRR